MADWAKVLPAIFLVLVYGAGLVETVAEVVVCG